MNAKNTVAQVLKVYAIINFVVCLVMSVNFGSIYSGMGVYFFAISLVVNFGIFAFGEVVQLLHEIRINTQNENATHYKDIADELPEL